MQALGGSPAEGREPRSCGKIGCAGDALDEMFARPWEEGSSSLLQREPKKSSERQMARCKANVFVARTRCISRESPAIKSARAFCFWLFRCHEAALRKRTPERERCAR
ncbi:hypothetical protein NN561_011832 [Cricetulus griseus]